MAIGLIKVKSEAAAEAIDLNMSIRNLLRRILLGTVLLVTALIPSVGMAAASHPDGPTALPGAEEILVLPPMVQGQDRGDLFADDRCSPVCCHSGIVACCLAAIPFEWPGAAAGLKRTCQGCGVLAVPEDGGPETADKPPRALI